MLHFDHQRLATPGLGCGNGDLKALLDERYTDRRYLGTDQMPEFIAAARTRFAHRANTTYALAHFDTAALPRADIVAASGALGYRVADPHGVFNVIVRMLAAAVQVLLVFNVLHAALFPEHPLPVLRPRDFET